MGTYLAGDNYMAFRIESGTFAAATGGSVWFGLVQEHSPDENENRTPTRYIGAGGRNVATHLNGPTEYTGTIRLYPQNAYLWAAAFGKIAVSGSPNYLHTITESGNTLPSFSFEDCHATPVANENFTRTYAGVSIDTLKISASEGEPVEVEFGYIAQTCVQGSGALPTVTAATDVPFMWDDCALTISGGGFDGPITEMKSFDFEANNNLDAEHFLNNSRNIGQPIPGNRDYSFNTEHAFTIGTGGDVYERLFRGGSEFNCNLFMFRTSGTDHIQIAMSGCKMTKCTQPTEIEGTEKQQWETTPESVTILIRDNSRATYPLEAIWA